MCTVTVEFRVHTMTSLLLRCVMIFTRLNLLAAAHSAHELSSVMLCTCAGTLFSRPAAQPQYQLAGRCEMRRMQGSAMRRRTMLILLLKLRQPTSWRCLAMLLVCWCACDWGRRCSELGRLSLAAALAAVASLM